jgi:anti-anti-sigma factor
MTTQHGDRGCTIRLRGELDSASAPTLCERVAPWLQTCRRLVVDMREVSFLDSAGLRAILDLYRCLNERGVSLHLIEGEEGNVPRVLRHAGLESLIRHDEASLS